MISLIIWFTWSFKQLFSRSNLDALANKVLCLSFRTRRNFLEALLFLILFSRASSLQELPTEDGEPWDWSNINVSPLGRLVECSKVCCSNISKTVFSSGPWTEKLQPLTLGDSSTRPTTSSMFWAPFASQDFPKTIPLQLSTDVNFSSSATWSKNKSPRPVWSHLGSTDQKLDVWSWSGLSRKFSWSCGEARLATPVGHENNGYYQLLHFDLEWSP